MTTRRYLFSLLLVLLLATPLRAEDFEGAMFHMPDIRFAQDWSTGDTVMGVGAILVRLADLSQTLQIEDHPGMHENNTVMGDHPSSQEIYIFFAASTAILAIAALVLPPEWRKGLMGGVIIANGYTVYQNDKEYGLRVGFRR